MSSFVTMGYCVKPPLVARTTEPETSTIEIYEVPSLEIQPCVCVCGDVSQWGGLMPGLQVNAGLFLFMRTRKFHWKKKIREWNSFVISLSQKLHPGQKCVAIIWCLLGVALCSARYEKRYLSVKTGESGIVAEWKFYFGQLFSPPAFSWRMRHTGAVLWVHRPLFSPSPSSPSFFYLSLWH